MTKQLSGAVLAVAAALLISVAPASASAKTKPHRPHELTSSRLSAFSALRPTDGTAPQRAEKECVILTCPQFLLVGVGY
jgi:hypothetical protein